jgi:hypothetical protein
MSTATKTTTDHPSESARAIAGVQETVTMIEVIGAGAGTETIEAGEMTPAIDREGAETILLTPGGSLGEIAEIVHCLKIWTQNPERYVWHLVLDTVAVRLT